MEEIAELVVNNGIEAEDGLILFIYALQTCCWMILLAHLDDEKKCTAAMDLWTVALWMLSKYSTAVATCLSMVA